MCKVIYGWKHLKNRNLSVHTYNEALANELVNNIKNNYLPLLLELKIKLSQKI
ncbi:MAG: nucleotidyltransferase substrate binding protein [Bacteroidales bacterium]